MFHGDDRSYVIAPLSSIVDERYTVRILSTALPPSPSTPTTSHTNLYTQFCLLVQGNPPSRGGGGGGVFRLQWIAEFLLRCNLCYAPNLARSSPCEAPEQLCLAK